MSENKTLNSDESKMIEETKNDVHEFLVTSEFLNEFSFPNEKKRKKTENCCEQTKDGCCEQTNEDCCKTSGVCCESTNKCSDPTNKCCETKDECDVEKKEKECSAERKRSQSADKTIERILKMSGFYHAWENMCKLSDVRGLSYMNLFLRNLIETNRKVYAPSYLGVFSDEELSQAYEQLTLLKSHFDMILHTKMISESENESDEEEVSEEENEDEEVSEEENEEEEVSEEDVSENEDEEVSEEENEDEEVSEEDVSENEDEEVSEEDEEEENEEEENEDEEVSEDDVSEDDSGSEVSESESDVSEKENICDSVSRSIVQSPSVHLVALLSWFYLVFATHPY
jgi:hypothetical protein